MKHSLFAAFGAVAVAGSLTLSAQTPTPAPSTPSRADDKTMTLTGCLKASDASMDAGSPTTTASGTAAAGKFVLTNIEGDSMGTTKPDATTPGTTTPSSKQYALTADAGVNLAAHVNHKVRVTGKLSEMDDHSRGAMTPGDPAKPSDPTKPSSTARPGEASHAGMGMDKASTLAVASVTMISSTCTGPTQ